MDACVHTDKWNPNLFSDDWISNISSEFGLRLGLSAVMFSKLLCKILHAARQTKASWLNIIRSPQNNHSFSRLCTKAEITHKHTQAMPPPKRGEKELQGAPVGKSTTYLEFYGNKLTTRRKQTPGREKMLRKLLRHDTLPLKTAQQAVSHSLRIS